MPVTGLGVAEAADATVGAVLATVTVALPLTAPLVAVTVPVALVAGAVNSPLELMEPPVTVLAQVKPGWVVRALPNWSLATAANCCVAEAARFTVVGPTAIAVRVWATVTLTKLVAVRPPGSAIVTVSP